MPFPEDGVVFGRTPGTLGQGAASGNIHPAGSGRPVGATPLQGAALPEITEPSPVRAHTSFGIKLSRCGNKIFDSNTEYLEIRQGSVFNCPLPAMLAAMKHTGKMQSLTVLEVAQKALSRQGNQKIEVDRYFEVSFPKAQNPVRVTDFFWGSGECKMEYARSIKKALWVSLIEKAFVVAEAGNSYERLSDANKGPDANTVVEVLTGKVASVINVPAQSDKALRDIIKKARQVPTIARLAAPGNNAAHAYMVEGMDPQIPDDVGLFDALNGVTVSIDFKGFKDQYDIILFPQTP